jgi:hypothetical protein
MYSIQTPAPGLVFDLPQALPLLVTINGRALATDGPTITLDRTRAVAVSFTVDRPAACDLYTLRLDELVDNAGVTQRVPRLAMSALEPSWLVPNAEFTTGATYVLQAQCQRGGLPGLATGDLVTRSWPMHVSYFDGGVFTIAEVMP